MEHPRALNEDFNLSTAEPTTVLALAELIWKKIRGNRVPFRYVSDPPFEFDVRNRIPDVRKAADVLGFRVDTTLGEMLDEVIPWVERAMSEGRI
jgi:UDP-glucose 4-epimerase